MSSISFPNTSQVAISEKCDACIVLGAINEISIINVNIIPPKKDPIILNDCPDIPVQNPILAEETFLSCR
ncbi:hypothetical protein BpHYR1_027565 [Brachionus plicatilis]|uniref:Uncharacterized protein n=1 Tax=Brachionus plicatilis TaxID=10195 RepID=A0A3M7RQD7_BRAPC|nr:hypothetical protein BpHYR1_027565 [Brachionus plicatilis]